MPLEDRKARLLELGERRLEQSVKSHVPGIGEVQWEPLKSLKDGNCLAADVQLKISHIEAEISDREQRIQALLGEGTG